MAGLARLGRLHVTRRFADRRRAVVATGAVRRDPGVAEGSARERHRALVAGLAWLGRLHVTRRLADRRRTVMATGAVRRDPGVAEGGT